MSVAAPKTLADLAVLAEATVEDLAEFTAAELDELTLGLNVHVTARVKLRALHRKFLTSRQVSTVQAKFGAFFARVGHADALAGLENVPVSPLPEAVSYFRDVPGAPSREAVARGVAAAYRHADALLAQGPDPHNLTRDEVAAINLYTQDSWAGGVPNLYSALNAALRSEARADVRVFWGYIRLLQHSLFKLPKDGAGSLFRGIKVDWMPLPELHAALKAAELSGEPQIWWGFSSTSTNLEAVNSFLGDATQARIIFAIEGGSSARDLRRYSHYQAGQPVSDSPSPPPCDSSLPAHSDGGGQPCSR